MNTSIPFRLNSAQLGGGAVTLPVPKETLCWAPHHPMYCTTPTQPQITEHTRYQLPLGEAAGTTVNATGRGAVPEEEVSTALEPRLEVRMMMVFLKDTTRPCMLATHTHAYIGIHIQNISWTAICVC